MHNVRLFARRGLAVSMLLFVGVIAWDNILSSWLLIISTMFFLIATSYSSAVAGLRNNKWVAWILLYYLMVLVGFFYSDNRAEAESKIVQKLGLVLLPIIIAASGQVISEFKERIYQVFLFSLAAVCISLEANAIYRYSITGESAVFFYTAYSWFLHSTYLSMLLVIGLAFCLLKNIGLNRALWWVITLTLTTSTLQLSSRAGLLSLAILWIIVLIALLVQNQRNPVIATGILFALTFIGTLTISRIDRFKQIEVTVKGSAQTETTTRESSGVRKLVWQEALNLISLQPLFGYGTGDANDKLIESYKQKAMTGALENKLNAHNQYLQTWLANGIVGLLSIVIILCYSMIKAIRNRDYAAIAIIAVLAFNFLFESMLERRMGIFTFAFFIPLLLNNYSQVKSTLPR